MIRILIVFFCLVLRFNPLASQVLYKPFAFNALTINDGLSQGMVTSILQDRYGFMWFATLDGLNRYDGYRFSVYRNDQQNPSSITQSFAQSLFEDSKGRFWIGTISGGLDLFERETETFIHIRHQEGNVNSLSPGPVESIWEDKEGNIWLHVGDKIDKITVSKNRQTLRETFSISHIKVPFHSSAAFLSITPCGKIYYAHAKGGVLYKLDDEKSGKWSVALNLDDHVQWSTDNMGSYYRIFQLLQDKVFGKFYVFHEGGVTVFDDKTGKPEKFTPNNYFSKHNAPLLASLDRQGVVWLSGKGNLVLYNTRTGELSEVNARDPYQSRILLHTYSTFIDRSGLLWIGTSGYGILKRNIRSEGFHHTGMASDYSIKEAGNGQIIIGNNLVVREIFDRKTGQLIDLTSGGKTIGDSTNFKSFLFPPIAVDGSCAWFADNDKLRCYNADSKKTTCFNLPVTNHNEYVDLIQHRIKDSSGNIWLGTTEGLLRFSLTDKHWKIFKNISTDSLSLVSNVIFSLCLDPKQPGKYLWIGTNGRGLARLDMLTGKSNSYSTENGLPNNVIYGILPDNDENLWMSTNKGLSCFNPEKQSFRNFDYKDGLQSNEFNRGAYCRTKDGCLFFGGVNGFNYFYPNEIANNMTVPQIVITGLKVRNLPVSVRDRDSVLQTAIYLTEKLTLPYEQNFLSFEFASLDFTNSEKNQYKYTLEGIDKTWINSNHTRSVTYTNLAPGTYTFRVKGSNNDGTWNDRGTSIQVTILPPWYMTWWFRTSLSLLVLGAAYSFYKYRLAQALKLQSIRNRIGSDLHDEVGSNLSNIFIFSNIAQRKAISIEETGPLLQKITDYTQQSMEAMDDIVWMINTRNDRFENILVRMRTLAAEFSETSDCTLHLEFDDKLDNVRLNMEARKNFYLIYKEAINNAAKYAACNTVWIKARLNHNIISLDIIDNGKGFDTSDASNGNGILNMKKRADLLKGTLTITSTIGGGTSLNLSFKV